MIIGVSGLPKSGKTTFINKFLDKLDVNYMILDTKQKTIENILQNLKSQKYDLIIIEGHKLFLEKNLDKVIDLKLYIYNNNIDKLDLLDRANKSKSDLIIPISENYNASIDILINHI
uniref:CobW/HypB/UreG nucleotide-binding domain-containing protein n=1 Tax=viral metagenome TaxID=1070528 RepID=A0A6C0IVS1_9ZZZZ